MTTTLRFLEVFALGTWVGASIFLSFAVAPGAFAVLATRDQAGAVVSMALSRLHAVGFVAGSVYLAAALAQARSFGALVRPAAALVLLMLVLTVASQYWLMPRMAELRAEMVTAHGSVDATPTESQLRVEFNHLHRLSVWLEGGILLLGLAALYLTVGRPARPF